jgi:hypothetical protein
MKKRIAEKVISRSILVLAVYRKSTMGKALRRRPRFWTVSKAAVRLGGPARRRLRVEFGKPNAAGGFSLSYEAGVQPSA